MPVSVLLISSNPAEQSAIGSVLRAPEYRLTVVPDPDDAPAVASQHDLLILDTSGDSEKILDLCRRTRLDSALASIPLLVVGQSDDVEERIAFLEAGADDVIGRPYDGRELEARVEALVVRVQRARGGAAGGEIATKAKERRRIAVFSPKGGVGTTTIAVNLAVIGGTRRHSGVLLIDLDLQFGGVAVHLDLRPKQSIVDVVRDDVAMVDAEVLRGYAERHESGLHVIVGTPSPEQSELVSPSQVAALLRAAAHAYETIVVDVGSVLDERALQALEWADSVILPFHPEIPALKAVHSLLDYLQTTGDIPGKSIFVLNNAFARQALRMRDIELALGTKVAAELPYDPLAYLNAANEGIPVVTGSPRSAPALRLASLADAVFGVEAVSAPEPQASRGNRFGILARGRKT